MIIIKSETEIKKISEACKIVAEILDKLKKYIKEGITTAQIETFVEKEIYKKKALPAFKGYRGYPSSVCLSLNSQVVHGIPSKGVKLKNGDIISIDLGVLLNGFYGDAAITLSVGEVSQEAKKLIEVTEQALYIGIDNAKVGNRVSDISSSIQQHVEKNGFSVVRAFVGHGIGRFLHEDPQIPNFGKPGRGVKLREGMTIAIEPMVNIGSPDVMILEDGWTAVTVDGSLSAHFEHTVAITKNGPEILTK
ncbi:MAG: type I methionyl aminopeptidase [Thermodesulfovibrionales bacterium]|nr:type I methionyl aminopeptidase [Thermodesulfovibrionales bacterium]